MKNLPNLLQVDQNTYVCGKITAEHLNEIQSAGIEHVVDLLTEEEHLFDEATAFKKLGIAYSHIAIANEDDLRQIHIMAFDKVLRQYHGKKTLMHCQSGNRVGAAMALRAGWLRGRKMETAMAQGKTYGLTTWEKQVEKRLLVPW